MPSPASRLLLPAALLAALLCASSGARAADIAALDADHDGRLSRAEVAGHPMLSRRFDEIDANHDGYLSADELRAFRQARKATRAGAPSPGAAPLGGPPAAAPAGPAAAPRDGLGDRLFQKADTNGNGVIDRAEAEGNPHLAGRFDELDANHDGVITPDELQAAMARRAGRKGGATAAVNSSPAMQVGPAPGAPGAAPAPSPAPTPAPSK